MIMVADVPAASRFYQALLGATSGHDTSSCSPRAPRHEQAMNATAIR
jgi:hypothetical protein